LRRSRLPLGATGNETVGLPDSAACRSPAGDGGALQRRRPRPEWCVCLFALTTPLALLLSQQPGQQPPPVFRTGVDLVRLDVTVLDAHRRPIRDLTAHDFTILVDGVAQAIVAFEPVAMPARDVPTATWMREVASDVRTNGLGEPRLFIIIMDDVVTVADPFAIQTAKQIARAVVDELSPGDLAAVLFTDPIGRRRSQDLTDDRAKLLEAIESFNFGMVGGIAPVLSHRTLIDVLEHLRARPQNRSVVIRIGPPPRERPDPEPAPTQVGRGEVRLLDDHADSDLATAAHIAGVPIYLFSTVGLTGLRLGPAYVD
jgi:hypothetical protein